VIFKLKKILFGGRRLVHKGFGKYDNNSDQRPTITIARAKTKSGMGINIIPLS